MKTNDLDFRVSPNDTTQGEVVTLESYLEDIPVPGDTLDINLDDEPDVVEPDVDPIELEGNDPEPQPEPTKKPTATTSNYKELLKGLMSKKLVTDFDEIEMEDGTTVSFDELDVDEETFASILETAIEDIRNKATEGKVDTKGISEFTQQLIEVEKSGGDVAQAIATYQKFKEPMTNLDLNDERDQEVAIYIRYNAQGLSDAEISKITKGFKAQGILEEQAHKAKEAIDNAFNQHMEAMKEEAKQREAEMKQRLVEYKDSLSNSLDKLSVGKALKKQITDSATKLNKEGAYELDKAYFQLRNNPEEAAELALFILNREEYLSRATKKVSRDEAINTMKKFKLAKKTSGNLNLINEEHIPGSKRDISIEDIFS